MKRLAVVLALCLPAAAEAHVTVHPNVIPEGAFAVLDVRVPNESDSASTTEIRLEMPPGFEFASVAPPAGWKADVERSGEEVSEITFSGGEIPPGQFLEFPISAGVPGKEGETLTFKALQTYSDGEIARWIGEPDADKPAPTIDISAAGGLIEDSTGDHSGGGHEEAAEATAATVTHADEGHAEHLAIAALIVGGLGLLLGGFALFRSR